jgi:hypothetical protein
MGFVTMQDLTLSTITGKRDRGRISIFKVDPKSDPPIFGSIFKLKTILDEAFRTVERRNK